MTPQPASAVPADDVALPLVSPDRAKAVGTALARSSAALATQLDLAPVIVDTPSLEQAVQDRVTLGEAITRVQEFFAPLKKMAHDLHRALCSRENEILAPLERVDRAKRTAISAYKTLQDRLRAEEERRLAEERRREEEARATAEAAALERMGDHEMAAAVMDEALSAPPPTVILPDVTKQVEGLTFVRRWVWKYAGGPADIKQTPPAVYARAFALIPREFLKVDEVKVSAHIRAHRGGAKIAGIQAYFVDDPRR